MTDNIYKSAANFTSMAFPSPDSFSLIDRQRGIVIGMKRTRNISLSIFEPYLKFTSAAVV